MSWSLAGNLEHRADAIRDEYPGITIYAIGDQSHQQNQSDHNPDARSIVHAIDAMTYSNMSQGRAIVDWLLSDPADLEYVIFDRTIWSRSSDFAPRDYTGSNPHTDHVHASGKHGNTGYNSATGTGYDTAAEAMRPQGFEPQPSQQFGGEMFLFTVEGDPNVWRCDAGQRRCFSGPDAGGINTYNAYRPLTDAGVPLAAYTTANIDAMGLSVDEALDYIGGPLADDDEEICVKVRNRQRSHHHHRYR